ncbi:MAG: hypothetical protein ABFD92_08025 [Planctomycetaceae bacterium]|nr:hypothetical protein [Planctomycetaceae bacterium]
MNIQNANTVLIDCGTMVGHQQTELELVQNIVPFFGLAGGVTSYLDMRLSNGVLASFRAIYRPDNAMWRIELSEAVPEIHAGVFPVVEGQIQRRSNYAAVFTKRDGGANPIYDLQLVEIDSPDYDGHLARATAVDERHRTLAGSHGRNFGWY